MDPENPMTTTPNTRTDRRPATRSARLAATAAAVGCAVLSLAGPVGATTPPATPKPLPISVPKPGPKLPDLDLKHDVGVNHHTAWGFTSNRGDSWSDVTFRSTAKHVVVQISTTKPIWVGDKYTMGAVQPQYLTGKAVAGNIDQLTTDQAYEFQASRDGLKPATQYFVLLNIPGAVGQKANYAAYSFNTKTRYVRMTPLSIHVSDDADHGLRGKGEISFGFRIAPEAGPMTASWWDMWMKESKIDSGDTIDVSKRGYGITTSTRLDHAWYQVQGRENDVDATDWDCAIEGDARGPVQKSDHCYDQAYAEAQVSLPTGRFQGAKSKVITAEVHRSPALVFQVKVLVESWYA